jgi:hypothetical protein
MYAAPIEVTHVNDASSRLSALEIGGTWDFLFIAGAPREEMLLMTSAGNQSSRPANALIQACLDDKSYGWSPRRRRL